jgi:hypothetical protein
MGPVNPILHERRGSGREEDRAYSVGVRRAASRRGFVLRRSRSRNPAINAGLYRIIHVDTNSIFAGEHFDVALGEVLELIGEMDVA